MDFFGDIFTNLIELPRLLMYTCVLKSWLLTRYRFADCCVLGCEKFCLYCDELQC